MAYDWALRGTYLPPRPGSLQLIVAGGLKPENVATAIAQLRPWGVDVSSGVEASPGRKRPGQLAQFIENARGPKTP